MPFRAALYRCFALVFLGQESRCLAFELLRGHFTSGLEVTAEANSNINLDSRPTGDITLSAQPEVGFKRDVALISIDISAGLLVQRFVENSAYNHTNPFVSAMVGWAPEGGKSSGQLEISARQVAQANQDVNQRTVSDNYLLDATFSRFENEKFGYRFHSSFREDKYHTDGLNDVRVVQAGLDARHQYSPKLESFLGFNARDNRSAGRSVGALSTDSLDRQFFLGFDGELLSKVKGRVEVGVVTRRVDRTARLDSNLFLRSAVNWSWKQNIAFAVNATRDFDTSPDGQSILRSSFGVEARFQTSAKIALSGEASYLRGDYSGGLSPRSDRTFRFRTGCAYSFSSRVQGDAYAGYLTNDSSFAVSAYNQAIVGITVRLKL